MRLDMKRKFSTVGVVKQWSKMFWDMLEAHPWRYAALAACSPWKGPC